MRALPIVCELTPAEIQARRAALLPGLLAQAEECTTLPNGFRWRFGASYEVLAAMAETINAERQRAQNRLIRRAVDHALQTMLGQPLDVEIEQQPNAARREAEL